MTQRLLDRAEHNLKMRGMNQKRQSSDTTVENDIYTPQSVEYTIFEAAKGDLPLTSRDEHTCSGDYSESRSCDAYVITGSRHGAYEELEWIERLIEWIKVTREDKKKIVGICFGHQVIAKAFGASVILNPAGFELGVYQLDLEKADDSGIALYYVHNDIVVPGTLPTTKVSLSNGETVLLRSLGGTELSPVNALMDDEGYILTFQGHPEFDLEAVNDAVTSLSARGVLPRRLPSGQSLSDCRKLLDDNETNGDEIGEALYEFLTSC